MAARIGGAVVLRNAQYGLSPPRSTELIDEIFQKMEVLVDQLGWSTGSRAPDLGCPTSDATSGGRRPTRPAGVDVRRDQRGSTFGATRR